MMKLLSSFLLILSLITSVNAQVNTDFYAVPYTQYMETIASQIKSAENSYHGRVELLPIGWSKDGKFAYIYFFPEWGFHGVAPVMPEVHIIIQDIETDKILWTWMYSEEEDADFEHYKIPQKEQAEISKALTKHAIIPQRNINFVAGGSYHDIDFKINSRNGNLIKVDALRKYKGRKTLLNINSKKLSLDFGFGGDLGQIVGLIRSPYEDRVAIIYVQTDNLGHNEFMTHYKLVGCHLDKGFK